MKALRDLSGLLLLTGTFAVTGCSLFSGVFEKDAIEGDPELAGMAVVSCDIIANFQDRGLLGTVLGIDDTGSATGGAITGVDGIQLEGKAADDVVVFANLQPGDYRLVLMRGERLLSADAVKKIYDCPSEWDVQVNFPVKCPAGVEFEFALPAPVQEELSFTVEPGEVIFLGNLIFDEPHDPPYGNIRTIGTGDRKVDFHRCAPNEKFRIERGPQAEIDSLENVVSGYEDNYWTRKIKRRLAMLHEEVAG